MVKDSLVSLSESREDLQTMVKLWWGSEAILKHYELLKGGYSCTNYLLVLEDDRQFVLKICKGYPIEAVEEQASLAAFAFDNGFAVCCHPFPLLFPPSLAKYTTLLNENPTIMVNFLHGKAGDYLIEQGIFTLPEAAGRIGRGLAHLHSTPLLSTNAANSLRSFKQDGICFLGRHLTGSYITLYNEHAEELIRLHPYVHFYNTHYDMFLQGIAQCEETNRLAVLHGDAFLDNVVFDVSDGELLGFVDFEDACVGPALLDVAIAIVGNCFIDSVLDTEAMKSLVLTYYSEYLLLGGSRESAQQELSLLLLVMKCVTIANASWRFTNFNITYPEYRASHGEKYLELQKIVDYLETEEGVRVVGEIINSNATALRTS